MLPLLNGLNATENLTDPNKHKLLEHIIFWWNKRGHFGCKKNYVLLEKSKFTIPGWPYIL